MSRDLYKYFRVEAREILDELGKGALALEKGNVEAELVARLFRLAHTLKGAAGVVKQQNISRLAHQVEDVLAPLRAGGVAAGREAVDRMLALLDDIRAHVDALAPGGDASHPGQRGDTPQPGALPSAPAAEPAAEAPRPVEAVERTVRAGVEDMNALVDGLAETGVLLASLRRATAAIEPLHGLCELLQGQLASPRGEGIARAQSMVQQLADRIGAIERELAGGIEQTDRELLQVREVADRLRLVPARTMLGAIERAARDAAVSVGKQVTFAADGGDVRLEAEMLAAMQAALIQAARNAVAHGIEGARERSVAGKPAEGRVTIAIARDGGRIRFTCRDDGRGVDVEAVRRAAREKGVLAADGASDEAVLALLLDAGISTATTAVSGRGVGLDVVRATARRFGGTARVDSRAGAGTTITVVVPASLHALDALVVDAGGSLVALPVEAVRRTLRVEERDIVHAGGEDALVLDERVVPFARLAALLDVERDVRGERAFTAIVLDARDGAVAVGVDRLVGVESLVVHPLPPLAPPSALVGGASLDLHGNPRLVLDTAGLAAEVRRARKSVAPEVEGKLPVLVIDDSVTTRMLEQSILESAGYEVDVAVSGEQGLEKAMLRRYGLFLVDVEMPGMDGFTFVELTRADPTLRQTPAILVTSRNAPEDLARGKAAGASDYVVKGQFDQTRLLARIQQLMG